MFQWRCEVTAVYENISSHHIFPDHSIRRLHRIQVGGFAIISQQQRHRRSIFRTDK
jgi:hypothetical protein